MAPTQQLAQRRRIRPNDYFWLARCEGFHVTTRDGRLGTVFGVHFDPGTGDIVALRVRTGLLRSQIVEMPVNRVLSLDARRRSIEVADEDAAFDDLGSEE